MEMWSFLLQKEDKMENIKDMGVAIPAFLLPIVEHVKSQVEDKADINKDSGGE